MEAKEFINRFYLDLSLNKETLQIYTVRKALFESIKQSTSVFSGKLLDIGCGQMPYRNYILENNNKVEEYIGLDIDNSTIHDTSVADILWDGTKIPLQDSSIDSAMATEVLEHCFEPEKTLKEINRVLVNGGVFYFSVPFIWPLHETPYDAYRYTPFSLKRHLENAGFTDIEIKSLGGWHSSFAQMLSLWATESKLSKVKRKIAQFLAIKFIPKLLQLDEKDNSFKQHCMISGLYGTAKKK